MADDKPTWDADTDRWFVDVKRELRLRRKADLSMLEVAAHAMHHTKRMPTPATDDLRLILDALTALRMRRRFW